MIALVCFYLFYIFFACCFSFISVVTIFIPHKSQIVLQVKLEGRQKPTILCQDLPDGNEPFKNGLLSTYKI